jgi:hypothetical protein
MNKSQFIYELKKLVAWDEEPQLDDDEIDMLFHKSRIKDYDGYYAERTQLWEPNTYYDVGDVIVPTSFAVLDSKVNRPDEHSYIVTTAGTSGATEPTWDLTVSDGSAAWERHEAAYWTPTYNLDYAAYLGWGLKAAKAASRISFSSEGASFQRNQFIANCFAMQKMYAARLNFSVRC